MKLFFVFFHTSGPILQNLLLFLAIEDFKIVEKIFLQACVSLEE